MTPAPDRRFARSDTAADAAAVLNSASYRLFAAPFAELPFHWQTWVTRLVDADRSART